MEFQITSPATVDEFEAYYKLRWEVLRAPWGKERGSEKDNDESSSIHFSAIDSKKNIIGVCRLQKVDATTGQIRFMAVQPDFAGKGIGTMLLTKAEEAARSAGLTQIQLQARENAVAFYLKNGYLSIEKTFLLFDEIQHYLMRKAI
jgi:N-acetylglutamate synthase-like GNAT family acetyltransferase